MVRRTIGFILCHMLPVAAQTGRVSTGALLFGQAHNHHGTLASQEGMSNSPDIWNAVNGLNHQAYEGALGASAGHQAQLGSFSSLQPAHGNLDFSPHSVVAAEMNRGLPPMSTFHRNNTVSRSPSDNASENPAGSHVNVSGASQTGDTLGKALASVEDRLDRLDDVIHVLRNHAVGPTSCLPNDIHGLLSQSHQSHPGPVGTLPLTCHTPTMVNKYYFEVLK
ncbi:hypothetical protein GOODEAATRI_000666 [Goodea atripinnis]|uniref:Transcription factor 12 n=1 Tax=Goodea atripinnis TaxID=208336 RepID=A0ABV0PJW0_9TELE